MELELLKQAYQTNEEPLITWIVYKTWEVIQKEIQDWNQCNEDIDKLFFFYKKETQNGWQKTAYGYFIYMSEHYSDHLEYIQMIKILQAKV
ncbi:hypothetical protein KKH82_01155 [Patescibacteria group bacterium]|nr:hypothetical protein [Patescibacteria group bacterium]